jgi:hypothetical protein
MTFWRILDNQVYPVELGVKNLGFEESEGLRIPDEYLEEQKFVIMRTCHGLGDWGIISAMPRLLKQKYPNCKVYVPSVSLLEKLFSFLNHDNWSIWENPYKNVENIFKHNPYVDGFLDDVPGEIFHDHYRIYNNDNPNIPLIEQMLKFWQFKEIEYKDSQPELYWSKEEKELGDKIIKKFVNNKEFGCLLISKRFGTQFGKYDKKSFINDNNKIKHLLSNNKLPYFYWTYKPLNQFDFNLNSILDMHNMNLRIQLYIKSKAKVNIGNQCGTNHCVVRYSDVYEIQRQSILGHNFVKGENYL